NMLVQKLGKLLNNRGWTLSVAESATGGLLGHWLTQVAGSSTYFMGGIIAYANSLKVDLLDVQAESLLNWGAVSPQVALEMAEGARRRLGTDMALSITGIAGPGGSTVTKPVGLAYVGLAVPHECWVWRVIGRGNRESNKRVFAEIALQRAIIYLDTRE
ncbi:MAG: CinA family protein, partial [Anaerolineae bacterium]|nr:CinA family protein [Anaerolineae bacterium]